MGMTEAEFLAAIAARRGRKPLAAPPPRPDHRRHPAPAPANLAGRQSMAEWFMREQGKLTGTAEIATDLAEAGRAVAAYLAQRSEPGRDVLLWDDPVALAAREPLAAAGFQPLVWPVDRDRAAGAAAGVTSCLYAVAETGSVAVASAPGLGRSVSLIAPIHITIVPTSRLLATAGEFFRALGSHGKMPAAVNLITGPSRTADIELELVVGVHGPAAVHAVLYHD